jgi:hypothetical protein
MISGDIVQLGFKFNLMVGAGKVTGLVLWVLEV